MPCKIRLPNLSVSDRVVLGGTCETGYQVIEIGYQVIKIGSQVLVLLRLSCIVRQVI
jgi:hypothetical protein